MSRQRIRTYVLASAALAGLISFSGVAYAAPLETPRTHALATSRLSHEVFGFALGSSLSDPSVGYPTWNFDLLSTVAYFGLHVQADGSFQNDAQLATWNSSQLAGMVQTAHAHGTKVVLTIVESDWTGTYPNGICSALSRASIVARNTVAEVKAKGVDGVNVDFESLNQPCNSPNPSWARNALTSFVQTLRAALGSGYYLSIDTYAGAATDPLGFFDVPGLNQYVDSFFVMAYDLEYSNWRRAPTLCGYFCLGPTSPLTTYYYNDTDVMAQYSAAVTASKVILGVPYYGRKACVPNAVENQHPVGDVTADSYLDASSEWSDPSVKPGSYVVHRDSHDLAGKERWDTWYSTKYNCTRMLYWDDATSLSAKYDLALRDGLRGVGIWNLNYGGGAPELWNILSAHFGGWAATYDTSQVPRSWAVGQAQTFSVKVTNTGLQSWPSTGYNEVDLDFHFATSAGGYLNQGAWVSSAAFALPHDVAPGASVTLSVSLTAPSTSGGYVLEAEMISEHNFWFPQFQAVSVDITPWVAAYDMSQVPLSWVEGEPRTFPITMTNIGTVTWPSTGYTAVDLDVHFARQAGGPAVQSGWLTSKAFSLPRDVAPGQSVTVTVNATAPVSGNLVFEAEAIKEHQFWFRQWSPVNVAVAGSVWSAAYDMSATPRSWTLGQSQTFPVTVTNTGNRTWPSTSYYEVDVDIHFASVPGGSAQQAFWLTSQAVALPRDLAAGQSATVTLTVTAPRSGVFVLEVEMIKEHQFWFAQYASVTTMAAPAGWSASYNFSQVPASWVTGQPQTFTIAVTNTGTQTWQATGYSEIDLDLHFAPGGGGAANQSSWYNSVAFSLPRDVAPGQTVDVRVTIAPPRSGTMVLEAEMIQEHHFWFLSLALANVRVT